MATKKDLVEAYSFSRRRLVTAFVSGAPGGREVEPARPGRTIVGGLALAVLLVAGAAIAGIFSPKVPDGWTEPGLIVSKETGAAYVITEGGTDDEGAPVLRPVINITSAKLILGAGATPEIVPQSAIDSQVIGDDIGILGAPASLPSPSLLIGSGWTACTDTGQGIRVTVDEEPPVTPQPGGAFLVVSEGGYHLIAEGADEGRDVPRAYSYQLPGDEGRRDAILTALGMRTSIDATRVSEQWLDLFPAGAPLSWPSFGLAGSAGTPIGYAAEAGLPADLEVGQVVETPGETLLLAVDGPVRLDDFPRAVYTSLPESQTPVELPADQPLGVGREEPPYDGSHWPEELPEDVPGETCAQLVPQAGETPGVRLGTLIGAEAEGSPEDAVPEGRKSQHVQAGRGAYLLSGDWEDTTEGTPFVIDSTGKAYELVGAGTARQLGYDGYDAPVVPDSWVDLFEEGVLLSQDRALCPPDQPIGRTCE
jgi:type VII secretion protein EccB